MFDHLRSLQQVGVLPFVETADGIEVLLVTTRRRKRWVLPKGWPKYQKPLPRAAAEEAAEEAGVVGLIHAKPIGTYRYRKEMKAGYQVGCCVFIYPMLVTEQRLDWVERRQRQTGWYALDEAAALIEEPKLANLIKKLVATGGGPLRKLISGGGFCKPEEVTAVNAGPKAEPDADANADPSAGPNAE